MRTIYLTGTPGDMQTEYEAIKTTVMPQLNEYLKQYGEEAVLAGFTDTSDDEGCRKELKSCFRELKKGNVYYVSLVSERYGDIPPRDVTEGFLEKVGIHEDAVVDGNSVMEIEVLYAALSDPSKALIYFRDPFKKKEVKGNKAFFAGFGESGKVKKLKKAIRHHSDITVHEYQLDIEDGNPTMESANALAHRILEDLKIIINADIQKQQKEANTEAVSSENTQNENGEENAENVKIPANQAVKGPINLVKAETPIWDSISEDAELKYNPEKLRDEAVAMSKNAAVLEGSDPEKAGDIYDEAMEIFRRIRKDSEKSDTAFDETLNSTQTTLVTDEVIRDMGLTYFAYARIEFNAKNFDGAAAWGKQAIDSLTTYQKKYNKIETIVDLSNVWMLMGAALANGGAQIEAIDAISAAMSCFDGLKHNRNFKSPENFDERYKSLAQLAHTICINESTGKAANKWLIFCQRQSLQLSKLGDNAAMINYVNFTIALCEYQFYTQKNTENAVRYINMLHEVAQMFSREKNKEMMTLLVNKGRNLLEVVPKDVRVIDIVCSMISLQANLYFGELNHEEALKNYTEVIEKRDFYKNSIEPQKRLVIAADYARRASAYTELNRLDEAQAGYDEAISILKNIKTDDKNREKINGELASAYMNRSVCLGKQGKIDEAKESLNKAYEYVDGKKLGQRSLILMRRRIRKMRKIVNGSDPEAMYKPELMHNAKVEMDKLRDANEFVRKQDYETAANMIEESLNNLADMGVVDIVIPSEGFAANLTVCGSIYEDKLNNEVKAAGFYKKAWSILVDMEKDGLRLNGTLVNNLKKRLKIK